MGGGTIAHSARRVTRWAEAAAGNTADCLAADLDFGAFARRGAAFGLDADPAAGWALGDLLLDDGVADEAALGAAALGDRPDEIGLDRCRALIDIVPVQAQPGLEPQRIAGTQADRL